MKNILTKSAIALALALSLSALAPLAKKAKQIAAHNTVVKKCWVCDGSAQCHWEDPCP